MDFYNLVLNAANNAIAWSVLGTMIYGLVCSWACYRVCLSKGYSKDESCKETGFGYLLGLIWLIVCLSKPAVERGRNLETQKDGGFFLFVGGIVVSILGLLLSAFAKDFWSYGLLIVNIGVILLMFAHSKA